MSEGTNHSFAVMHNLYLREVFTRMGLLHCLQSLSTCFICLTVQACVGSETVQCDGRNQGATCDRRRDWPHDHTAGIDGMKLDF